MGAGWVIGIGTIALGRGISHREPIHFALIDVAYGVGVRMGATAIAIGMVGVGTQTRSTLSAGSLHSREASV
jgi:hypothetical protein